MPNVKRHLLPIVAFLVLSSCTPVGDFAAYWDKGFVDPALEGRWQKIGVPGEPIDSIPGADQLLFVKNGQSYFWQGINPIDSTLSAEQAERRKKDNDARLDVRTLKIGNSVFIMSRGPAETQTGVLERYEIQGDLLLEYTIDNGTAVDLLEAKYPTAKNIHKNKSEGSYVVIDTFDDEVFRILSEMSASAATYWQLECRYRKIPLAGTDRVVKRPGQPAVARAQEEISTRVASAPSRVNLPALNEDRLDRVFLMEGVGEWRPSYTSSSRMPADQVGGATFAPRPERISYYAYYSRSTVRPDASTSVTVHITQYPNAEWARFDVLNNTGQAGLPRLSQFGSTFYQDGPYFSWSNGDRLILLNCSGMPRPVIDEFLKAYLAKYPSDL
jgi:hypothetical protein